MKSNNNRAWFAIQPILSNLVIVSIVLGAYYYLFTNNLFPEWMYVIYWVVKIIIAFEIVRASARSLVAPLLALATGLLLLFTMQVYYIDLIPVSDAWELVIMSGIGFVITVLVKLI